MKSKLKKKLGKKGIDLSELKTEDFEPILPQTIGRELRGAVLPRKKK